MLDAADGLIYSTRLMVIRRDALLGLLSSLLLTGVGEGTFGN